MMSRLKVANVLRKIARTFLLVILSFWFIFALLSGAGRGWKGFLSNAPNALPWLVFLILVYVTWKKELIGGTFFLVLGVFSIFFFHTYRSLVTLLGVSLFFIITGVLLLSSWYLRKEKKLKNNL